MKLMARYTDNCFGLGFIDPEYGIKAARPARKPNKAKQKNGKVLNVKCKEYKHKNWDDKPASVKFGNEVFRVCKNWCIWGANYFEWVVGEPFNPPKRHEYKEFIKNNPRGWIIWDKVNGNCDQMDCELLKTSFEFDTIIIEFMWAGMRQGSVSNGAIMEGNKKLNEKRYHPCHKPVRIYDLIFAFLFSRGFICELIEVLETNLGAGSIALSCHNNNLNLIACDIESEYCDISKNRLKNHQSQQRLF